MSQIALDVSRNGTVRTLRDQFTSQITFLRELLQNARRAGAQQIHVTFRDGALTIEDDGHGIEDPQSLLLIGKSNWEDLDLMARENPFGIGFVSSLFAAEAIHVHSRSWRLSARSEDILAFHPVAIEAAPERIGTRITLMLSHALLESTFCTQENAHKIMQELAECFPVDISFNGERLASPNRLSADTASLTLGELQGTVIPTTEDGFHPQGGWQSLDIGLVLQGFWIGHLDMSGMRARVANERRNAFKQYSAVIHLNPSLVRARVPDRDQLLDVGRVANTLDEEVKGQLRHQLAVARHNLPEDVFVDRCSNLALLLGVGTLINDMPLKREWVRYYDALYAYEERNEGEWDNEHLAPNTSPLLVNRDFYGESQWIGVLSTYLEKQQVPTLEMRYGHMLDKQHWAWPQLVDIGEEVSGDAPFMKITPKGQRGEADIGLFGWFKGARVIICEAIDITPRNSLLEPITATKAACFSPEHGALLVTVDATQDHISEALLALDSYGESDDSDMEEFMHDDDTVRVNQLRLIYGDESLEDIIADQATTSLQHLAAHMKEGQFLLTVSEEGKFTCQRA